MKKSTLNILLALIFLCSMSSLKAQVKFDLIVIFQPTATFADITAIKTALNAVQLDSTFPSRALLWRCSVNAGSTITIPKLGGGVVTSSVFLLNSGGSEAVGVICGSGQSDGVGLNGFYIVPETNTSLQSDIRLPLFGSAGGAPACNAAAADSIVTCTFGRRELRIAIMDSGIDLQATKQDGTTLLIPKHDTLKPFIAYRNEPYDNIDSDGNGYKDDQIGYNFVSNDGFPQDSTGHGTFVAGVIARILNLNNGGNIKFYILKVLDAKNKGYEYDFIRAIDWSVKQKVEIVNCSFISSFIMADTTESPLAAAIRTAQKSNLLVSVAAGNNGKNVDLMAEWRSLPSFQLENMIVTGATVCTDSVAAFSNFGVRNVDIFTIGKNVISTWLNNQMASWQGTSFCAPQTTAIAALLASNQTTYDWKKVKCAILNGASFRSYLLTKCRRSGILNGINSKNILPTVTGSCEGIVPIAQVPSYINSVIISPNPTRDLVNLDIELERNTPLSISVLNAIGQSVLNKNIDGLAGKNQLSLNWTGEKGIYFILIETGGVPVLKKIVKM
jgi:Subtilase family/Secretion system C-terminal sorting domain